MFLKPRDGLIVYIVYRVFFRGWRACWRGLIKFATNTFVAASVDATSLISSKTADWVGMNTWEGDLPTTLEMLRQIWTTLGPENEEERIWDTQIISIKIYKLQCLSCLELKTTEPSKVKTKIRKADPPSDRNNNAEEREISKGFKIY